MKKLLFALFIFLSSSSLFAQKTKVGFTLGYSNNHSVVNRTDAPDLSENLSGFYGGFLVDIHLSPKIALQPKILYANYKGGNYLSIPVLFKYYLLPKLNVQVGPQATFLLTKTPDYVNALGLSGGIGAGYDLSSHFSLETNYFIEFTNRYQNYHGYKAHYNFFNLGLIYKF